MKTFTGFFTLLFGLGLLATAPAEACPPIRRAVVVQAVPVGAGPAVFTIPTYAASYGQASGSDLLLQAILDELKGLRGDGLGQQPTSFVSVAAARCAACHTEGKPAAGTEFVLLDKAGALVPLSLTEKKLIALRTGSADPAQRMPPAGQLGERERRVVQSFVKGQ